MMRSAHQGIELWYATPDAPAVDGDLPASISPTVTVAVRPIDAGNSIRVVYRIGEGSEQFVDAKWVRNDTARQAQYFTARLPQFRAGDSVQYYPLCRCAGRQLPPPEEAEQFSSSFRVVEAGVEVENDRPEALTSPTQSPSARSANNHQPSVLGNGRARVDFPGTSSVIPGAALDGESLRLLSSGRNVSLLQEALVQRGISIDKKERQAGTFGLSTREAVQKYQKKQGIRPTGIADAATLDALHQSVRADDQTRHRDILRRSIDSLRKMSKLGITARTLKARDDAVADEFQVRMAATLRQRLVELFDQPSEKMVAAINQIPIDLDEVAGLSFADFVFTRVAPELLEDEALERELFEIADRELDLETDTIAEMLGLDRDVRDAEELRDLVNWARNTALGDIVGFNDIAIEALADIDLLERGDAVSRLVEEGKLTAEQRHEILVAADLARLTDDNVKAIRALRDSGVREPRELVTRGKSDWLRFIEDNEIEPPDGETADSYAALLDAGVERAFPTAYALTRYAAPVREETLSRLSALECVPHSVEPLFTDGGVRKNLDLSVLSQSEAEAVRADLSELARFSRRYAALGIPDILNDPNLTLPDKRKLIQRRQAALEQAWTARPDLDLDLANFIPLADPMAQAFTVELDDIAPEERPYVRRALMALQRTHRLSDSFAEAEKLMDAGLDTAAKIAAVDDADRLAELTGLTRPAALRVRAHALETRTRMLHFVHGLEDTTGHAPYQPMVLGKKAAGGGPGSLINVLKDLPGYSELFGPQNYCKCRHCQSIFGPAAYFVDLMRFIDIKISAPNFTDKDRENHPLYLKNRRGDLWTIPLTCENTDKLVIYLTIVNDVLENYLTTVAPHQGDVFAFLATKARSSFHQPFNLHHAEILLYLKHLGVNLAEVSALFDSERKAAAHAILGISPQELATLATAEFDAVRLRFAKPHPEDLGVHDTAVLTKQIGVDRDILERLLASDYVVANVHLETEITSEADDLVGFVEHLRIDVPNNSDRNSALRGFLDRLHRFARLVRALGWTPEEVQLAIDALNASPFRVEPRLVEAEAIRHREMIAPLGALEAEPPLVEAEAIPHRHMIRPPDGLEVVERPFVEAEAIPHMERIAPRGELVVEPSLVEAEAIRRMHAIRPPGERDVEHQAFGAILDMDMLSAIADLKRLMDGLALSVSEAIALCYQIPDKPTAPGMESLWSQLFGERQQLIVKHPALGNREADGAEVSPDFGKLQYALHIAEPDLLALLRRHLSEEVLASGVLKQGDLHRLYRSARLARALGLSQQDLAALEGLVPSLTKLVTVRDRLSALIDTMEIVKLIDDFGVKPGDLLAFLDTSTVSLTSRPLAAELLEKLHADLQEDDRLWLTPGDLSRIEGVTPEAARVIIQHLVTREEAWLTTRPDETAERYLLTDAVGEKPDVQVLQECLSVSGAPLAGASDDDHAIGFLTEALLSELGQHHPAGMVRQAIRQALALSSDVHASLDAFLTHLQPLSRPDIGVAAWLRSRSAPPPQALSAYTTELVGLKRLFVDTLDAKSEAIAFVAAHPEVFGLVSGENRIRPAAHRNAVPLPAHRPQQPGANWTWTSLRRIASFAHAHSGPEEKVQALYAALAAWNKSVYSGSATPALAQYFDVTTAQMEALLSELPGDKDAFDAFRRIEDGVRLTRRTGLDPASLRQLVSESYAGMSAARDLVLGAMRTKHPTEEAWRTVEEPFIEKIEGLKRDALVDRILSRPELGFDNARDMYHFFLLDPEMDGCFRTSRVENAIASCQLYVQHCLMGLEQSVDTQTSKGLRVKVNGGNKTREEWKWRKSYRVWEANRKVFLYPENYMLPDLRDDRSHIFKIAERDLLQGNLDKDAIEQVFKRYLSEFVQIGNLEIVHVFYDRGITEDYLLFGRTRQEPFRYFMRRFDGKSHWEPWEPIDLDIGARTVSAVKKRGRLYLFWTNVDLNSDADRVRQAQPQVDVQAIVEEEGEQDRSQETSQETLPIVISYSTRDEAGNWSSPEDILYYNLLLSKRSVEKNALLPISDRIYAEFPHPNDGSGGVSDFIRLIHPVEIQEVVTPPPAPWRGEGTIWVASHLEWRYQEYTGFLRESDGKTVRPNGKPTKVLGSTIAATHYGRYTTPGLHLGQGKLWRIETRARRSTAHVDYIANGEFKDMAPDGAPVLSFQAIDPARIALRPVQRKTKEAVLQAADLQYLIKLTGQPGYPLTEPMFDVDAWQFYLESLKLARWKLVSLTTGIPATLSEDFYSKGLDSLLSPQQQYKAGELPSWQGSVGFDWLGQIKPADEDLLLHKEDRAIAQFSGVHGHYLWELFFHLPFLIAHTLNSIGKFEEADRWYRHIFDPTASGDDPDAHWRFVVFRTLKLPKLREVLTQKAAIKAYKNDPFNPFAIARERLSAFEKTIVMRYIDNLLDWGDELFRRDTRESINEALLLYVMAADLLGERPVETGECEVADSMNYADIALRSTGGEFLIELENLMLFYVNLGAIFPASPTNPDLEFTPFTLPGSDPDGDPSGPVHPGTGFTAMTVGGPRFEPFATVRADRVTALAAEVDASPANVSGAGDIAFQPIVPPDPDPPQEPGVFSFTGDSGDDPDPDGTVLESRTLGFCVPPNDTLLGYWDRVEDRLYKLRNCMNIEGVVRQLPLWQPPIDPMLLVRAKAAGLELDDVLPLISEQPPHHRFEVLLERARRFAATAQQLGSQLLSALERKDESELVLLRSVHEDTILSLSRRQKEDAIAEAEAARSHLDGVETTIKARLDHYSDLLANERELKISKQEQDALDEMQSSKDRDDHAGDAESMVHLRRALGPQWSAGASGSVGTGSEGKAGVYWRITGDASITHGSANLEAGLQGLAFRSRDEARKHRASAERASTRAGYQRREEEWRLQRDIAKAEIDALVPHKLAADIRIALAEKELETHDAQIKNSRELYDFAKERFSNLGLYTYLSTSLSRLHREAYDMALKMAQTAERAYRFEVGEDSLFLKLDNWDASRAGLLAADRLLLQLQAMEAAFVERDRRRQEVTLPCTLSQIDPDALVQLRQTGRAEFSLPEWWFDLFYPGQYRRILQSLRLTMPCITGPYRNVAARLTLLDSAVRSSPSVDPDVLVGVQVGRNTSISTSTANSDPGVFELRFDAPKNPPFKGAGAVSRWSLVLPASNRVFDYSTISDAIVELSYTAEDDGLLRDAVEGSSDAPGSLDQQLEEGFVRIISLRHEFPTVFHKLKTTGNETTAPIELSLDKHKIFPYWLSQRQLQVTQIDIALEPRSGHEFSMADIQGVATVVLNGEPLSNWFEAPYLGSLPVTSSARVIELGDDPVVVSIAASLPDNLDLHDLLIRLTCSTNV